MAVPPQPAYQGNKGDQVFGQSVLWKANLVRLCAINRFNPQLAFPGLNAVRSPSFGKSSSPNRAVAQMTARFWLQESSQRQFPSLLLSSYLGVHLIFGRVGCYPREMFQDDSECVLMDRWQFGQLRTDGREVTADVKLPIFRITLPFMLGKGKDRLGKLPAVLLEHRRNGEHVMLFFRELEGFFVYPRTTVTSRCDRM